MNPTTSKEERRQCALDALGVLDTPPEERFDRVTRLAAAVFRAPVAMVSLIDHERQWFKSSVGFDVRQTPRSVSFCTYAVAGDETLVVPDACLDVRFADSPLVLGAPFVRFYAGCPVHAADGQPVGTLCIIDHAPRQFGEQERGQLRDLAQIVEDELIKGAALAAREQAERALQALNADLENQVARRTASLAESEARNRTIIELSFSAFVSTDDNGLIVDWNSSAERTFGWTHDEVAGRPLADTIVPERLRAAHLAGMQRYRATGSGKVANRMVNMPALTRSGREITIEMTITAFPCGDGVFFGAFMHDITERLRTQRAAEEKQQLLDAVLDTIDVGVLACSATGEMTLVNRALREIHGLPADELPHAGWVEHFQLYAGDGKTLLAPHQIPLWRALNGETLHDAEVVVAVGGVKRSFLASGCPLASHSGEPLGAVLALKDVTELSASRRQMRASEQHLLAITENLPTVIAQVDRDGCFNFVNSLAAAFYGRPRDALLGRPVREGYPDGQFDAFEPHYRAAMAGHRVRFEADTVVAGQDMHYLASLIPNLDAQGTPNGFYAMSYDITARKISENRLRESEERLRTIANNLPVLISYIDRETRYGFANALYEQWFGVGPDAMVGRTVREVFGSEFSRARAPFFQRCLAGETVQLDLDVVHRGATRVVRSVFIPHLRAGRVVGAYVLSDDVTAARRQEVALRELANTDSLTGLPNRRSYEVQLGAAINRAGRTPDSMALLYLDIDRFKEINDTLGHASGDEVLKEFARRLCECVRKTDTVSRLAGDEFTIILENVNSVGECELVGQKLVEAMARPFELDGDFRDVTASIGIAWCGKRAPTARMLALDADAALYKAKAAGGNQYVVVT